MLLRCVPSMGRLGPTSALRLGPFGAPGVGTVPRAFHFLLMALAGRDGAPDSPRGVVGFKTATRAAGALGGSGSASGTSTAPAGAGPPGAAPQDCLRLPLLQGPGRGALRTTDAPRAMTTNFCKREGTPEAWVLQDLCGGRVRSGAGARGAGLGFRWSVGAPEEPQPRPRGCPWIQVFATIVCHPLVAASGQRSARSETKT